MAQFGCGGSRCTCQVAAGPGVTVTGNGSPGTPYVIGATVTCDQVRPCLSAGDGITYDPAAGLIEARPSTDAGNSLGLGTDGGLLVPPAAPLTTGCGLTGDGTAAVPLSAAVSAWPYACDVEDQGGVIVCDGAGVLRGEPRSHSGMTSAFFNTDYANEPFPGGANVLIETYTADFTNPDPCSVATVVVAYELEFHMNLPAGAQAEYGMGGPDEMVLYRNTGTTAAVGLHWQVSKVLNAGTAAPGATIGISLQARGGRGTLGANFTRIQGIIRCLFITR